VSPSKMKIGLAIYNFDPKKGGAERYAFDLSMALRRRGHDIYVFCCKGIETPGMHLIRFNAAPYPRWLRSLMFALNHRKWVKNYRMDVMLGFGNTLDLDVYQSHGGVQKVWMEQEILSYDDPKERRLKALVLRNSMNQKVQQWISEYPLRRRRYRRIVAISDMVKRHISEYYGPADENISVVYNGVDTDRFRPTGVPPAGNLRILFSAGNFRLKGLMPLLLALGKLSKETRAFHLSIMGRGRQGRYTGLIEHLNMRDLVTFVGETGSPEKTYREAHILAHPTFYDACSLTTMEAMASGLPTITTRWNGASALISEGEGFVIDDPSDIDALCSSIGTFLDGQRRAEMGRNARLKLEQYTMENNADGMERIFYEVLDGKHGR
jgi:UDP-glucose:(heptosyl)LPS alpha-1,3-glucosyltransferase